MINGKYNPNSRLAKYLTDYIELRKREGFDFGFQTEILLNLDLFLYDYDLGVEDLTTENLLEWTKIRPSEGAGHCNSRNNILQQFIVYLQSLGFPVHVSRVKIKVKKSLPYLLSDGEVRNLFTAVDTYKSPQCTLENFEKRYKNYKRLEVEYKVILRLILSCGLRINEACVLQVKDVVLSEGYFLIRSSKGDKDRLVYMTKSMTKLLSDYLKYLNEEFSLASKWVFPALNPEKPLPKTTLDRKFAEFWDLASGDSAMKKHPTVHSLRHKMVINTIDSWVEQGLDMDNMMSYLSKYLGHSDRSATYYYYHTLKESLEVVRNLETGSAHIIPEAECYD